MKICDFCTATKIISDYVAESKNINQLDFMYELFKDFIESDEGAHFDFDNGLVCRWLNGTARISTRITSYYSEHSGTRRAFGKYRAYTFADERYGQGKRKFNTSIKYLFKHLGGFARTYGEQNIRDKRTDIVA